ncbi:MAG: diphthine synthase [Methanomicrobiales archaeon]|nr:diphthine synthase [Methanomicrobiales archaeon]
MLTFVGLGLYDLGDIPLKGLECIRKADYVFLESYTSRLSGASVDEMAKYYGREIRMLSREEVEVDPEPVLGLAEEFQVAFLTGGDPMVSTTHIDLRMRASRRGITTNIIHASSISTAVCGLSGLQNYRFGKSCSLPYPHRAWMPLTPAGVIRANRERDLHTLVYLDIREECCMTIPEAVNLLEDMSERSGFSIPLYVGVARAGSESPVVAAGDASRMREIDFGPPLHILIVPAELHVMEKEYLEMFAGL